MQCCPRTQLNAPKSQAVWGCALQNNETASFKHAKHNQMGRVRESAPSASFVWVMVNVLACSPTANNVYQVTKLCRTQGNVLQAIRLPSESHCNDRHMLSCLCDYTGGAVHMYRFVVPVIPALSRS